MIGVDVGEYDVVNLMGTNAEGFESADQLSMVRAKEFARTGVDQNVLSACLDQKRIDAQSVRRVRKFLRRRRVQTTAVQFADGCYKETIEERGHVSVTNIYGDGREVFTVCHDQP